MSTMDVFNELRWRDLVYDSTEGLPEVLAREKVTAYVGFDPTAASLHVGSLLPIMALARLQRFGHTPIALVGGGTGLIGDPSGKTTERPLQRIEQIEANAHAIRAQLERFLDFSVQPHAARMLNNVEWLGKLSLLEFLRDVGKHFTVNSMLAKDSVKRRLGSDEGLSFTEFSYQLLQAYDFAVLHERYNCTLQMGGSDQWGNITAGIDLVRRLRGARVHGLVLPLVTTAAGTKFGKTEAGAVWLDPHLTSPFRFYQFWLQTDDRDVVRYLKYFTWLEAGRIGELARAVVEEPERREAQQVLAREVTTIVHGRAAAEAAARASAVLFGSSLVEATADEILAVFEEVPSVEVSRASLEAGVPASALVVRSGLAASRSEAVRLIRQGGVYVNDQRLSDERGVVGIEHAIDGRVIVLRKGARERRLVRVVDEGVDIAAGGP